MEATRWVVVAYGVVWAFVFGSLAWGVRTLPAVNGDRVRWPILAGLSFMGLMWSAAYTVGAFVDRDLSRELVRWFLMTGSSVPGFLVFKLMRKYWPWKRA